MNLSLKSDLKYYINYSIGNRYVKNLKYVAHVLNCRKHYLVPFHNEITRNLLS